jgi:Bacterial transcriptional regulator
MAWRLGARVIQELAEPLQALTERTITDACALRRELARVRASGVAASDQEFERGCVGFSAAVTDWAGRPAGGYPRRHRPKFPDAPKPLPLVPARSLPLRARRRSRPRIRSAIPARQRPQTPDALAVLMAARPAGLQHASPQQDSLTNGHPARTGAPVNFSGHKPPERQTSYEEQSAMSRSHAATGALWCLCWLG